MFAIQVLAEDGEPKEKITYLEGDYGQHATYSLTERFIRAKLFSSVADARERAASLTNYTDVDLVLSIIEVYW